MPGKPGKEDYGANEEIEINFPSEDSIAKFHMKDGCVWTGPYIGKIKNGSGTLKTNDEVTWKCTYKNDSLVKS